MNLRKDGEQTRAKILQSACRVFGEKGYRNGTNAEICERADVNIAAINYHFGSKDALYRAVCRHALDMVEKTYPVDGETKPGVSSAEDRLRAFIKAFVQRRSDRERFGYFHRIRMMEMFNSTGLVDDIWEQWLEFQHGKLVDILNILLGPDVPQSVSAYCEMSVVSQCLFSVPPPHTNEKHAGFPWMKRDGGSEEIVEHILKFSLAGIEAARRNAQDQPQ